MRAGESYVVVAYDIPDDRRRAKLARLLAGYGDRVQRSVFECDLRPSEYEELVKRVGRMWCEGDLIRIYRLTKQAALAIVRFGGPGLVETPYLTIIAGADGDRE
ncbi:CRISPR-associated endonuclease Cas2 2 [bacterium HR29]|nr:CRISPR-associated endonuclease Cas2 2 [bacterium HR29]